MIKEARFSTDDESSIHTTYAAIYDDELDRLFIRKVTRGPWDQVIRTDYEIGFMP